MKFFLKLIEFTFILIPIGALLLFIKRLWDMKALQDSNANDKLFELMADIEVRKEAIRKKKEEEEKGKLSAEGVVTTDEDGVSEYIEGNDYPADETEEEKKTDEKP